MLEEYINELVEVLNKFDLNELEMFILNHEEYYSPEFLRNWDTSDPLVKEWSLCKMVLASMLTTEETKEKARKREKEIRCILS